MQKIYFRIQYDYRNIRKFHHFCWLLNSWLTCVRTSNWSWLRRGRGLWLGGRWRRSSRGGSGSGCGGGGGWGVTVVLDVQIFGRAGARVLAQTCGRCRQLTRILVITAPGNVCSHFAGGVAVCVGVIAANSRTRSSEVYGPNCNDVIIWTG